MQSLSADTLFELLLNLSGADLLTLCATNKSLLSLCEENNDYFWQLKVEKDYPSASNKPGNLSWKRFYVINFTKRIPLTYVMNNSSIIPPTTPPPEVSSLGLMWINRTDTPEQILQRANKIFLAQYPDDKPQDLTLQGPNLDMFWYHPITNAKLITFDPDHYDLANELIYSLTAGLKHRLQGKEGIIRMAMMGR